MRKAVWSKHAFCCAHVLREDLVKVKMARKKEGTWTANSTKRCKQVQIRWLLVEIRVIQRKGGFVAVRNVKHGRDDSFEIRKGRQTNGPVASQDMRQGVRLVGTDAIAQSSVDPK